MVLCTLILGVSLGFTACSDDDDKSSNEQKKDDVSPLDTDDARVAFRWLCQLTDVSGGLDKDWQSKTYEPTVGQPSDNNQYTRIVVVSDLDEAKILFSKLADVDPDQLSAQYAVNGGAAGTMTWETSSANAENLAVVTVRSRILPHLQKLVYCTEAQVGNNGYLWDSMKGTPYYRLGDVIRDADGYYWICVRPAFAPADKEDSHWINVFNASAPAFLNGNQHPIPEANIENEWNKKPKYNNATILLPTKLPYDRQHIYNLSQLLWAMLFPDTYKQACLMDPKSGLCGFEYRYHDDLFLSAVATHWNELVPNVGYSLWEVLFGVTLDNLANLKKMGFFYQGYKWWWGSTADMWRFSSNGFITGKYKGSESNDKESIEVVEHGFDINRYAADSRADTSATGGPAARKFVGSSKEQLYEATWVVRYKSGKQLYNGEGKYSPHKRIEGCTDIYVYNKKENRPYGPTVEQDDQNSRIGVTGFSGHPYYQIGDVYKDQHDNKWFVIEGSGNEYNKRDANSIYSYLISFDGIETTLDHKRATNLPSRDMAMKAVFWLDNLAGQVFNQKLENEGSAKARAAWNINEYAKVDVRTLFDFIMPRSGNSWDEATHLNCVAYRSDDGEQRVFRFLNEAENITSRRMPCFYFWERYRNIAKENSDVIQIFDSTPVLLRDINNQERVNVYGATDPYAKQPVAHPDVNKRFARTARTQTDPRSLDVRNYFYTNGQFATDARSMWNEPVLFFRVIRVADLGDANHETKSMDGNVNLTLVSKANFLDDDEDIYFGEAGFEMSWGATLSQGLKDIHLNNKQYYLPTWKTLEY